MASTWLPAASARPLTFGAIGGAVAAWITLGAWMVLGAADGQAPLVPANAVGAWLVRWLQSAAPSALGNFYPDATIGGLLIVGLFGALAGAVLGAILARAPRDGPLLWGAAAGLGLWLLLRWAIVPGLDPVLGAVLGATGMALACIAWGLLVGLWHRAGRRVSQFS